ncbi:MAG: hypothetical protein M1819_002353 [Sarea resinae]|nr:MAG: hypothetical protein M1819_002353 [Sarea resinae]
MTEEASSLPLDFLTRPGPTISASRIDFNDTPLSEYKDLYATVLDGVLSEEECRTLVAAAEAHNDGMWEPATINHGGGRQELALESRNCGRIMWDCPELAERLLARVTGWIPELQALDKWPKLTGNRAAMRGEVWKLSRLNERMRFLRYGPGQYFSGAG